VLCIFILISPASPQYDSVVTDGSTCPHLLRVCSAIESVGAAVVASLSGANIDNFLLVFGWSVYEHFVNHIAASNGVSTLGAGVLVRDIGTIQRAVADLHVAKMDSLFAELRTLANLFFVDHSSVLMFLVS
jgi:hypothetical protein